MSIESSRGPELLRQTIRLTREAIDIELPATKGKLRKPGIIKAVPQEKIIELRSVYPEKGGVLDISLEIAGIPEITRSALFNQGRELVDTQIIWDRLSRNPTFYYDERLNNELSSNLAYIRATTASQLGTELVRFYLSGMAPKRVLEQDIWPQTVKESLGEVFYKKAAQENGVKAEKLKESEKAVVSLINDDQGLYIAKGAQILFEIGDSNNSSLEFHFGEYPEDNILLLLSEKSQKTLMSLLENRLRLPITPKIRNIFSNGPKNRLEERRELAKEDIKAMGMQRHDQVLTAYLGSKIPEYIEGLKDPV